jgi:hypothetical protein
LKGNVFSALHIDSLKQVVADVKLQLGSDALEAHVFIDSLIAEEKLNYDRFVVDDPEILLPPDLSLEVNKVNEQDVNLIRSEKEMTPSDMSLKDSPPPPKWTEVVKRGRSKTSSRTNKSLYNEGRILEY